MYNRKHQGNIKGNSGKVRRTSNKKYSNCEYQVKPKGELKLKIIAN